MIEDPAPEELDERLRWHRVYRRTEEPATNIVFYWTDLVNGAAVSGYTLVDRLKSMKVVPVNEADETRQKVGVRVMIDNHVVNEDVYYRNEDVYYREG